MPTPELIFYDAEFTGLHQRTSPIAMGFSGVSGEEFYAEFSDYDAGQCDAWLRENVLAHTRWLRAGEAGPLHLREGRLTLCLGGRAHVAGCLGEWLGRFAAVEIWADCLAWDWVLFCELFGGALRIPPQVSYLPRDLATLFHCKGLDADTPRAAFAGFPAEEAARHRHNALWDARLAKACHRRLAAPAPV